MNPSATGAIQSLPRRRSPATEYALAVASIIAATIGRWLLDPALGDHLPFAAYLVAIAFTAWFTRLRPSIVALFLGALAADFFFVPPRRAFTFHLDTAASQVELALYLATGMAIIAVCEVSRRARHGAELRRQELGVTLASIGDGVVTTDSDGCVSSLNPVAEALTGWTLREAFGRPLDEVFRIVNEETRETVESPVARVFATGTIVGLGNHTVLVAKDGTERPIDDSAAPIRDSEGEVLGVVLIFRDVTERRRAERERFQLASIVESSDDAIIGKSLDGTITSWNRGAEKLYGYTAAEVIGKPVSVLMPPEKEDEFPAILERLKRGEEIEHYETVRVRKGGERIEVSVTISPVHDSAGRVIAASAIARDISARKKAEEELRESLSRNAAMVNASLDGIITIDERGNVVEFNPAAEKIFGYSRGEALGREMAELIIPERLRDRHRAGIAHYLATGEGPVLNRHIEMPALRSDGLEFPVELALTRINQHGPPLFTGYIRDIGERKRTEEHMTFLAHTSELFGSSLDFDTTMKNIVGLAVPTLADWAVVDIASRESDAPYRRLAVVHVDPAKAELAMELRRKYPRDPSKDRVLHAIRTGQSELVTEVPEERLREASHNEEHFRILKELGIVSWMIIPLRYRDVPIGAVTFVASDSRRRFTKSDLAHAEEFARRASTAFENSRLYSEAQQANRAKDNFLATLSHELRTPMTSILGWARMLGEGDLDDETYTMALDSIQRSAALQADLIEDVLDMSRIASGKMRLDVQMCDLAEITDAALATVEPAAAAKGIAIDVQKSGPAIVTGDPKRLQQVIWNLLTNAIKFTPRGGQVHVRVEPADSMAQVTVSDTGQGFAREFGVHAFEPFRQAESATTRTHGGLGLGLSIVRYLVEQHGGVVTAESAGAGQGATFRVRIPLRALKVDERGEDTRPPRLASTGDGQAPCRRDQLQNLRILFVDDQEDARTLFRMILQRCGASVTVAQSVDEAIEKFEKDRFEVVVTDIAMPGRDGFELIAWLNAHHNRGHFQIIALTAFGGPDDRQKVLAAGCEAYLKKPVEPAELIATIERVSDREAAGADRRADRD
jgi:PAS domain S-box-containing protein